MKRKMFTVRVKCRCGHWEVYHDQFYTRDGIAEYVGLHAHLVKQAQRECLCTYCVEKSLVKPDLEFEGRLRHLADMLGIDAEELRADVKAIEEGKSQQGRFEKVKAFVERVFRVFQQKGVFIVPVHKMVRCFINHNPSNDYRVIMNYIRVIIKRTPNVELKKKGIIGSSHKFSCAVIN